MKDKDYIVKLQQKSEVLKALLEECQEVALNRKGKAEKCFESKRELQLEIKKLNATLDELTTAF